MADVTSRGVRKPRKSRGRGLRATTGCLVCKRRHVKCDEVHPQCGPCAKGQRACLYATIDNSNSNGLGHNEAMSMALDRDAPPETTDEQHLHEPLQVLIDACENEHPVNHQSPGAYEVPFVTSPKPQNNHTLDHSLGIIQHAHITSPDYTSSPATESPSTRGAPLSWFELLANDAVNADPNLLFSPPQGYVTTTEDTSGPLHSHNLRPRDAREHESFQAAAFEHDPELEERLSSTPAGENGKLLLDDPSSWSTASPIKLSDKEKHMLQHFVQTLGLWLDFFDPSHHFSTTVPHLALRNIGVMKALLALTARHLSICNKIKQHNHARHFGRTLPWADGVEQLSDIDRNVAVEYYFETLHYLNKAMQYPSYACSHEIISTAILISTYEMIDGSNSDWERHLKGVFWIQRYQDNDGECGGIRQAVWWAWLRQDTWVALRERRRVFSFWRPKRHVSTMTAAEIACYSHYMLSQCINYASREESKSNNIQKRLERGNELLSMLQEWYDYLPPEFNPLPTAQACGVFPPIWVNPSSYAAALQVHSLARLLVIVHRPSMGAVEDFRAAQKLLTTSVNTICGIAQTIREDEIAASLISLECLYGAGMGVHTAHERAALLDLVDSFQKRVCWPRDSLRTALETEYQKDELSGFAG